MERGPSNQPIAEQTPSDEKKESKKSKKKDVEKLGAFVVEARPSQAAKKAPNIGERLASTSETDKSERQLAIDEQLLNDKTPELNGEAPLEHLSEVEARAATQELARNRRAELAGELAQTAGESLAADQAEAAAAFLAKAELTGDPETALEEVLSEFEIQSSQESDDGVTADMLEEVADTPDQPDQPNFLEGVIDPHQVTEGDVRLDNRDAQVTPNAYTSTTSSSNPSHSATGGGTTSPRRPTSGGAGGSGQPPLFGGGAYPYFNAPRAAMSGPVANPNTISTVDAYYNERRAQVRGLLVGGIVGYLIGRRRGRIKTEKRLLPVQNKLEREVQILQANLLAKEIIIRQATAEKRRAPLSPASEQLVVIAAEQKRHVASESKLGAATLPPERIGHVLIAAERGRGVAETTVNLRQSVEKQVTTMPRAELLTVSEKITVEGTTLRQIYETHLIGERALRRLVMEHLSGGDVQRVLRRELVEREIDFERDPILRDRARASLAGAGKSALNSLVQQAGATTVEVDNARVAKQKNEQPTAKSSKLITTHRLADVALISTITVLLAIIVLLLAYRQ